MAIEFWCLQYKKVFGLNSPRPHGETTVFRLLHLDSQGALKVVSLVSTRCQPKEYSSFHETGMVYEANRK